MRTDAGRLRDMQTAADRILAKTQEGREAFLADEMLPVWVRRHLQIIGEM
jgi:uncharacterized protein with HEPN domain